MYVYKQIFTAHVKYVRRDVNESMSIIYFVFRSYFPK